MNHSLDKMQSYDTYKPSNIDWIGEIPSHWKVMGFTKSINLVIDYRGKTPTKTDEGIFLVTAKNIKKGKIDYDLSKEYISEDDYESVMCRGAVSMGDVLFTTEAPLGEVANIDKTDIALAQRIVKFRGKESLLNNYYLKYSILSQYFIDQVQQEATGSTVLGIKASKFSMLYQILPSLQEQQTIVIYLDQKITLIDELIEKKQSKIELLKEQRTSLINHAVTKGLNTEVAFKDSKIEWIGDIPEHWKVKKLKFVGDFQNGISKGAEYFGEGYPFMNYGDVYKNEVTPSEVEGKVQSDEKEREQYSILRGDVFFTRTSESKDDIGISSTCLSSISNCVFSGFVIRFRFFQKTHIPEYSKYHFQTHWKKVFIESQMNIVTRSSLSQQVLGQVPVLIPPLSEQQAIGAYLDEQTALIDKKIELESQKITTLKEYRQSLISAVVTGKICVIDN
jgi:type I restriction enzyme, S subunit